MNKQISLLLCYGSLLINGILEFVIYSQNIVKFAKEVTLYNSVLFVNIKMINVFLPHLLSFVNVSFIKNI